VESAIPLYVVNAELSARKRERGSDAGARPGRADA
jgi:hypothetical protein